jgi:hypothetical protein
MEFIDRLLSGARSGRSCVPVSRSDAGVGKSALFDRGLTAYAHRVAWVKATPDDWATTAALSFIGAGFILQVGIGLRWPLTLNTLAAQPEHKGRGLVNPAERS